MNSTAHTEINDEKCYYCGDDAADSYGRTGRPLCERDECICHPEEADGSDTTVRLPYEHEEDYIRRMRHKQGLPAQY